MRDVFLGKRRGEWVAYLKAVGQGKKACRYSGSHYDDGMCHGIIPFGAVITGGTKPNSGNLKCSHVLCWAG